MKRKRTISRALSAGGIQSDTKGRLCNPPWKTPSLRFYLGGSELNSIFVADVRTVRGERIEHSMACLLCRNITALLFLY
jgi:hypothetical protein